MTSEKGKIQELFEKSAMVNLYHTQEDYNLFSRRRVVFEMARKLRFKKMADLGCGSGGYLEIKKERECEYYGLDFSEHMLQSAKKRAEQLNLKEGVHFYKGNAEETPYAENTFDLIIAIGLIEYFDDPHKIIKEIGRILRKGGTVIIQSFMPTPYVQSLFFTAASIKNCIPGRKNDIEHKKYNKKQLDGLFEKHGFRVVDYAYSNFHILPLPFADICTKVHTAFSEYAAKHHPKGFSFLAVNYIAQYRLNDK